MPLFSIIIPVYNVAQYLEFCLNSVINQVFTDYECILIDDGSTDESPNICDNYSLKDNRIKVIHKKNGGLSDARNTGILNSTGEYIVLLDSDDSLSSIDSLLNLSIIINKTNVDVIFNSKLTTFFDNNIINSSEQFFDNHECYYPNTFFKYIMHNNNILLAGWLFSLKKKYLLKYNLFFKSGLFHEDELWMPLVICYAEKIAINHNPFYSYRIKREKSIMSELNPKRLIDMQLIIDELQLRKNQVPKNVKFIIYERSVFIFFIVFNSVFTLAKKYKNENNEIIKKLNKQKTLLFYVKKIKNYIFLFLFFFIGIKQSYYLKEKIKFIIKGSSENPNIKK